MSNCHRAVRPLTTCLRQAATSNHASLQSRAFTSSLSVYAAVEASDRKDYNNDPLTVLTWRGERSLMKAGKAPVGSRRRRAALRTSDNLPFEQLPYQCFQEARKVLAEDREEKIAQIQLTRQRIQKLEAKDASGVKGGAAMKQTTLQKLNERLEYLKIQADINDPMIKKRFEDGEGMSNILDYGQEC